MTQPDSSNEEPKSRKRPDPYFKMLTLDLMTRHHLLIGNVNISQAMEADMLIIKPHGLDLDDDFLSLLADESVLEFKSQNDKLDWEEYCNAVSRAFRYAAQNKKQPHLVLNLIVTSRYPDGLFKYLTENGGELKQPDKDKQPWLWQGQVGPQRIIIIVCRDLPIAEEWYDWLAFAPTKSEKWREFAQRMLRENNERVLKILEDLSPKELEMERRLFEEFLERGELDPEFVERVEEERVEAVQIGLVDFTKRKDRLARALSVLKPEDRLAGLKPEDRLAGLKPEDRLAGLKPEDLLDGLTSEKRAELLKLLTEKPKQQ